VFYVSPSSTSFALAKGAIGRYTEEAMKFLVATLLLSAAAPGLCARVELGAASESAAPSAPTIAAPTIAPLGSVALAPSLSVSAAPSAALSAPVALAPAAAAPAALAPSAVPVAVPVAAGVPGAVAAPDAVSAAAAEAAGSDEVAAPSAHAAAAPAAPAGEGDTEGLRAQLSQLALGIDRASQPGAAADAPQSALQKFWDNYVRDRHPAPVQQNLDRRLEAGRSFLRESLKDPAIAARVAFALKSSSALAPEMNQPREQILARLRAALDGGRVIRVASPDEARTLTARAAAAAVTLPDGRAEIQVHPGSALLTRAPPALLATTLLHELVHTEFGLGEYAAYVVEAAYYLQLTRLVPELARDPDAAFHETIRRDVLNGELAGMITANYGDRLRRNPDDVIALARDAARRRRRVADAIDDVAALNKSGRWDRMDDKSEWLERRLPRAQDRREYFALMNDALARLPDGAPFSAAFDLAAQEARREDAAGSAAAPARASGPNIRAHLEPGAPPAFGRRGMQTAAPAVGGAVRLDSLRTAGYAAVPPYALIDRESESAALAEIDSNYAGRLSTFLELSQPPSIHSAGETRWDDAKHPRLNALLRPLVERLTAELNRALPGENVKVRDVQVRLETKARAADTGVHVDLGGYVTATYSLRGGGTDLYLTGSDGSVRVIRGMTHAVAIVTNMEREWATGVPGTVHAAPALDLGQTRVVLIVRYYRPGYEGTDMPDAVSKRLAEAIKARNERVRSALEGRSRPAESGGLLDRLRGALR